MRYLHISADYLNGLPRHDGIACFIGVNAVGVQVRLAFLFCLQHCAVKVDGSEMVLLGQLQQPLAVAAQGFVVTDYVMSSLPAEQGAFRLGQDGHADIHSFFSHAEKDRRQLPGFVLSGPAKYP